MYKSNLRKRDIMTFKHFCRKGYALFACHCKEVRIGVLAISMLTFANSDCFSAQTEPADTTQVKTNRELTLEEVVVTGSRAPMTVSQ